MGVFSLQTLQGPHVGSRGDPLPGPLHVPPTPRPYMEGNRLLGQQAAAAKDEPPHRLRAST